MHIPISTYRIQFNASFSFNHLDDVLTYLNALGIQTVYASPVFSAVPGSLHGYDVTDPGKLNPEIGTPEQWQSISRQLEQKNMYWLQDIVPNHMAFSMHNKLLADVLERGQFSPYYRYFDIDWEHPDPSLHGRFMVPFLAKPPEECLHNGEIKLAFSGDGFIIEYTGNKYPLSISAWHLLLNQLEDGPANILRELYYQATLTHTLQQWREHKQAALKALSDEPAHYTAIQNIIEKVNQDVQLLQQLLQDQYYLLSWWKETNTKINYRRFFAVNELIALRMEDEAVFNDYHSYLSGLYGQGSVQGLRIDHIDGLLDQGAYIKRLRTLLGEDCYLIAEKILERHEPMPQYWDLQGTSGYEFLHYINWLLTYPAGAQQLVTYYQTLFPGLPPYETILFEKKQAFLQTYMGGEWDNLVNYFYTLQLDAGHKNRGSFKEALGIFMLCLPVYRLYPDELTPDAFSQKVIEETFNNARNINSNYKPELDLLETTWQQKDNEQELNQRKRRFLQRLMQFTGPLTAKGVEDTTFYVYNALLGHNEVGDTPAAVDFSIDSFHQAMIQRQQSGALSLNTTATHDTKRGEDARLRLNVLTLFASEWQQQVQQWRTMNQEFTVPELQDEYFIYQSILSGFPADGIVTNEFTERLQQYFIKAVREAKCNSNWHTPDTAYENACCDFIRNVLSDTHTFVKSFLPFFEKIQGYATLYSLTQVLVKITAPGIPDTYQGCELWDLSYVDPDNRRPVDYTIRKKYLLELEQKEKEDPLALLSFVTNGRQEGLEKFFVTWKALTCRKKYAGLFTEGSYIPLYPSENCGLVAYARKHNEQWVLVVAPVMNTEALLPGTHKDYKGIHLVLPSGAPVSWKNEFTGETITTDNHLLLNNILIKFPLALLTGENR